MTLPLYLAMTAVEMSGYTQPLQHPAYMACHFSPYSTGLSNMPEQLPEGAMLILNDRIPAQGHDAGRITEQLQHLCQTLSVDSLLLDLQRQPSDETCYIVEEIVNCLDLPLAASEPYAADLNCAVFLSPPPMHIPLKEHIAPWSKKEIWLEVATDCGIYTITKDESIYQPGPVNNTASACPQLHCHYGIHKDQGNLLISLQRCTEDIQDLLQEAKSLNIQRAIGLYQQLSGINYQNV